MGFPLLLIIEVLLFQNQFQIQLNSISLLHVVLNYLQGCILRKSYNHVTYNLMVISTMLDIILQNKIRLCLYTNYETLQ